VGASGGRIEQQKRVATLFGAIGKLPDMQKVAFTLHHLEGLSYAEIADVMQMSVVAVESLLHRA